MTNDVFASPGIAVKKENLYEVIADRIEGMILDNRLHPAATAKVALRITAGQIAQLESLIQDGGKRLHCPGGLRFAVSPADH